MLAVLVLPVLLAPGAEPPADALKLNEPKVQYRVNEASATTSPWIDANGWRIERAPARPVVYRVKGAAAALAAAESFAYGAAAYISTDAAGEAAFGRMRGFLETIPAANLPPVADFGVIDDGSDATGELLNLLSRMNLLFKIDKAPDRGFHVNVRLGDKEYPLEEAQNPSVMAHKIRSQVGDDNRSLRVYGSEVVVARLLASPGQSRVMLLNYSPRPVLGVRIRVKGSYASGKLFASGAPESRLMDLSQDGPATEFTVPEIRVLAVIDLARN